MPRLPSADELYLAPTKTGKMCRIVFSVSIPGQYDKLQGMGIGNGKKRTMECEIARFTNEELCALFLEAYKEKYGTKPL